MNCVMLTIQGHHVTENFAQNLFVVKSVFLEMSLELTKVATVEIIRELERRLRCAEKKETRAIFFGPPGV